MWYKGIVDAPVQIVSAGRPNGSKNHTSWTRHRLLMYLLATGKTQKEAAAQVGMTPQAVSIIARTDAFKSELSNMMDEIRQEFTKKITDPLSVLTEHSVDAANTLVDLLASSKPEVRKASASDILDRVMGKAVGREIVVSVDAKAPPPYNPQDPESVRAAHAEIFGQKGTQNATPDQSAEGD